MSATLEQTVTSLLAAQARADATQFTDVHERVAPVLYGWIVLNLRGGLRARLDAEDIAQETWMRALRNLTDFDAKRCSFRTWLIGIARNVLFEAFRSLHARPVEGGPTTRMFALDDCPATVTSVTRRLARDDWMRNFIAHVDELDEDERVLVRCCGLEGLGASEAASRLGISPEAAKKRWQRLRTTLAAHKLPRDLLADGAT